MSNADLLQLLLSLLNDGQLTTTTCLLFGYMVGRGRDD